MTQIAQQPLVNRFVVVMVLLFAGGCAHPLSARGLSKTFVGSGQWEPDRRFTYSHAIAQLSYHFTKSIAADRAGRVHVVWYDTRDGDPHIYYKRSTNGGATWGPDIRLSQSAGPQEQPAIAIFDSSVYVVWHDLRDGSMDVFLKRSLDGGKTWGPDLKLSHGTSDSMYPSIAVSGSHLHVTFSDNRDGPIHVYYSRSDDGGVTWTQEIALSRSPFDAWTPSVTASGNLVYVSWTDTRDGSEEEYVKRSIDGGTTWEPEVRLTNDLTNSWASVIQASGQTVHLAWFTQKDSHIQPRDPEHKLDEILALLLLPVQAEPSGVVLLTPPKSTKERIEVKIRKIHATAPDWVARGGDIEKLRTMLREFERMTKPLEPFEAEKQLDAAMHLLGLPVHPASGGEEAGYDVDALQTRLQAKMHVIEEAIPTWIQRSGDLKQLRVHLNAFNRLVNLKRPSLEDREKKLDGAMQLLGISFVPEEETARVYYLDAMQERIKAKMQQIQAAMPAWVQRGGNPKQLEGILQEVEQMVKASTRDWQIYYRRSTDGGTTWEPELRLTGTRGSGRRPSLEVVGREVHLVWMDMREDDEGIYYRHSPDGGVTWGPETYLVKVQGDWGVHPSVAASKEFAHLVWVDQRDGNAEVYYKRKVNQKWSWNYGE